MNTELALVGYCASLYALRKHLLSEYSAVKDMCLTIELFNVVCEEQERVSIILQEHYKIYPYVDFIRIAQ